MTSFELASCFPSWWGSALSQFDQDRDDDLNDLEENLHMLVEDSSSDGDDEDEIVLSRVKAEANNKQQPPVRHLSSSDALMEVQPAAPVADNGVDPDDDVFLTREEELRNEGVSHMDSQCQGIGTAYLGRISGS